MRSLVALWNASARFGRPVQTPDDRKRVALLAIREQMARFGHSLDHMTDDELEAAVVRVGQAMARCGLTAADAMRAVQTMLRDFPYVAPSRVTPASSKP